MQKTNVLLVGSGGREHALALCLAKSPLLETLHAAPGNPGIRQIPGVRRADGLDVADKRAVVDYCRHFRIGLVVVGPEQPLADGLADVLRAAGIRTFGPSKKAAILETSKGFVKDMCRSEGIPTADFQRFSNAEDAKAHLQSTGTAFPVVVKADGLAAGKGVVVAGTPEEALEAADKLGPDLVIEEFLQGDEFSLFVLVKEDGKTAIPFLPARDYKQLHAGGPNTGGMGAICPAPGIGDFHVGVAMHDIVAPALEFMRKRGAPFQGLLYAGLMRTPVDNIKLIEFNVRFGDPETQALLALLESDLLAALLDDEFIGPFAYKDGAAACVVLAGAGYPDSNTIKGALIPDKNLAFHMGHDSGVLHAGTAYDKEGYLVSSGGRVLNAVATGPDLDSARAKAYAVADRLAWPGSQYRKDIGL